MGKPILFVLAGGGFAQVESATGCLMALAEAGIPVNGHQVADWRGTSAGAIVASVIAAGWTPARIASYLAERRTSDFVSRRWFWPVRVLAGGPAYRRDGLASFLRDILPWESFYSHVTVIMTRRRGWRRIEGPASFDRVMASSAIDGIFGPWPVGDEPMVDGGYTDNVPLEPWQAAQYGQVYLILPPRDPDYDRHARTAVGRLLQGLDAKTSQETDEAERIYSNPYRYPNVLVLRPPPIRSSLLALSPERTVMLHAYHWTERLLADRRELTAEKNLCPENSAATQPKG